MPFPTVSTVIDDFAGATANPIGGNWSVASGFTALQRDSNARVGGGTASVDNIGYWNVGDFGPDVDLFFTIASLATASNMAILARLSNPGSAAWTGYAVQMVVVSGASNDILRLYKVTNGYGTKTQLGSDATGFDFAVNDMIGLRCQGSTIQAWYAPAGTWEGSARVSATDATYTAAGKAGIYIRSNTQKADNFTGGTVSGAQTLTQALTVAEATVPSLAKTVYKVLA